MFDSGLRSRGLAGAGALGLALVTLSGCGTERGGGDAFGSGMTGVDSATSGDGGLSEGGLGDGSSSEGGGGGIKLDVAAPGSGGGADDGGSGEGCKGIDFLFVIDNSSSMKNEQETLIESFPEFVAAIEADVQSDFHIMVVDSDEDGTYVCDPAVHGTDPAWPDICPGSCPYDTCPPTSDSLGVCTGYPCGASQDLMEPEDRALGCGVVAPYGGNASNTACGVAGDHRFMTHQQPDLEQVFACAATVGTSGNVAEQPVTAMLTAVDEATVGPGGCNEGFLRDDAILVVLLITDDNDEYQDAIDESHYGVGGSPQQWYEQLLAAKGGDPNAIAMIGILATDAYTYGASCDHGQTGGTPYAAEKFIDFVELFGDRGLVADTCDPDYASLLSEAVELIDTTCDEFEPEG